MNTLFNYLKEFMTAVSWPVALLLIIILFRNRLRLFITAVTKKVERPGEISITKNGLNIKEYVDQKIEEKQNETISMIAETGIGKIHQQQNLSTVQHHLKAIAKSLPDNFDELKNKINAHLETTTEVKEDNDPLQKTWEGKPEDKNRRLSAAVKPIPNSKLYKIKLIVKSTSLSDPLKGKVRFHLHPTFADTEPVVDVVNGKAELNVVSYGSFTLGAETDNNTRKLKLDLARDVPGVSEEFKKA